MNSAGQVAGIIGKEWHVNYKERMLTASSHWV